MTSFNVTVDLPARRAAAYERVVALSAVLEAQVVPPELRAKYAAKTDQAKACLADQTSNDAAKKANGDLFYVAVQADKSGVSMDAAAAEIMTAAATAAPRLAWIEATRLNANDQIQAAQSPDDIDAVAAAFALLTTEHVDQAVG